MTAPASRLPLQEQIDALRDELRHLSMEMGFTMRYCRAAAQALGAIAEVKVIDQDRALWEEQRNAGAEEETSPSRRLKLVDDE